jgi:hypothetical protein
MRVAAKKEEGHVRSELQPVLQIIFLRKQDNWNHEFEFSCCVILVFES